MRIPRYTEPSKAIGVSVGRPCQVTHLHRDRRGVVSFLMAETGLLETGLLKMAADTPTPRACASARLHRSDVPARRGAFARSGSSASFQGVDYRAIVTIEPGKRGGKPCIRGLRITVYDVLEYLASGMSEAQILADFPDLTSDDIRACLAFAADRERRLLSVPAA